MAAKKSSSKKKAASKKKAFKPFTVTTVKALLKAYETGKLAPRAKVQYDDFNQEMLVSIPTGAKDSDGKKEMHVVFAMSIEAFAKDAAKLCGLKIGKDLE